MHDLKGRRAVVWAGVIVAAAIALTNKPAVGQQSADAQLAVPIKAGIIGLDAHALPWTKIINNPQASGELADMTVVAGYPGGSPDIPQSLELRKKSVGPIADMGVEIVDSIDELLEKVDVVMILSIDGRTHLEQAKPVFAAGKPVFIDKPIAASLAEAIEIFRLARSTTFPVSPVRHCASPSARQHPARPATGRTGRLRSVCTLLSGAAPSRLLLVRHPWRRAAVDNHGPRLRVGHTRAYRGNRHGGRCLERRADRHISRHTPRPTRIRVDGFRLERNRPGRRLRRLRTAGGRDRQVLQDG